MDRYCTVTESRWASSTLFLLSSSFSLARSLDHTPFSFFLSFFPFQLLLLFPLVSIELFQLLRSSNYCFSPTKYNSVCLANCRIFRFANHYSVTVTYFLEEIASTKQLWTATSSVVIVLILIKKEIKFENKQILIFLIWHIFFDNINNNSFSVLVPFYAANTIHAVPSSFSPVSFAQYSRNHMHVF